MLQDNFITDPTSADAWCNYGLSHLADPLKKAGFAKAISLDQHHGASHVNMGNALVSTLSLRKPLIFKERVELESSSLIRFGISRLPIY